ncbi:hypothetical protein N9Q05_01280 [bacterium]|nr:hypothetical protein [bacterium]
MKLLCLITGLLYIVSGALYAVEPVEPTIFSPADATHVNWVFSGIVANEAGENYDYLFQMQRDGHVFHVIVALFDAQNKSPLIQVDDVATIDDPSTYNWHVGHAFMQFNPINASWIFGVKDQDKKGFNFKVDMLRQTDQGPIAQNLRQEIEFVVSQTGQLNGHIQTGIEGKEQFVTAKNAWFRQIASTAKQSAVLSKELETADKVHQLQGVLCRFDDGSGFYSMNMFETDAQQGAVAGWFDAMGAPSAMSQFINVKQDIDGPWHIRIASPSIHLILTDSIKQNAVVAGFVAEKDKQGFCMLSEDAIGEVG